MENGKYHDDINEIHRQYLEVISPFVIALEVEDNEFPAEIMNEIRAIMAHMGRYYLAENDENREKNILLAKRHVKRAILDCFKYTCLSLNLNGKAFLEHFKGADLRLVDNGCFLGPLLEKERLAKEKQLAAKDAEIKGETGEDDLYQLYEEAYHATMDYHKYLTDAKDKLVVALSATDRTKKLTIAGFVVGIVGMLVGIAGLVIK